MIPYRCQVTLRLLEFPQFQIVENGGPDARRKDLLAACVRVACSLAGSHVLALWSSWTRGGPNHVA